IRLLLISTILKNQTSNSKPNNYTSPISNQDAIVTRVRSKSLEQANTVPSIPKLQRSYSLSDLNNLSVASKKYMYVLITSPKSNTDKSCVEEISQKEFNENYKSDTSLWGFSHCTISQGNFLLCFLTPNEAIKIRQKNTSRSYYHKGFEIEKIAAEKTSSFNHKTGLFEKKIQSLDKRSFYLYNYQTDLSIAKVNNLSHTEEALLEDCERLEFSSKEELFRFCAYTFHQLNALHEADIYHMDIKPDNICKTKNNSFKIIDLNGSLNFSDEKVFDRLKTGDYSTSSTMIPLSFIQMLTAEKNQEKARIISRSCDLFATGSTIYQVAYAFSQGLSIEESAKRVKRDIYPYQLSQNNNLCLYPSALRDDHELEEILQVFNTRQKELIKKTMSFDPNQTPTLKDLKEAFPILR
ncbi:MAG: serine/threonine-protein kinase, partial [Chlamydiota bacterium]